MSDDIAGNEALVDIALEATVDLIVDSVERKDVQYDASAQDLVDDLTSGVFTETINDVVATAIVPVLTPLADEAGIADVIDPLADLTGDIVDEASKVISGFDYSDPNADVSDLVAEFVSETVVPAEPITVDTLNDIAEGTTAPEDIVTDIGELTEVQDGIEEFAVENPDLFDGDLTTVTDDAPPGTWGEDNWGEFIWG